MKKFVFIFLAIFTICFTANAQVSYQKPQPKQSEMVASEGMISVLHTFKTDVYDLRVRPSETVDDSAFICLGKGKDAALQSLKAIKRMIEEGEDDGYINISGKKWRIADLSWTKGAILSQQQNISGNWIYLEDLNELVKKLN